jgi:hypothetical protein
MSITNIEPLKVERLSNTNALMTNFQKEKLDLRNEFFKLKSTHTFYTVNFSS